MPPDMKWIRGMPYSNLRTFVKHLVYRTSRLYATGYVVIIEMKSGKGDEYSIRNKVEPKENNKVQMLLYQAVLQYSMKMDHHRVKAYLLYTRYPLLYPARPSWAMVRRVINLRNRIVAEEYGIQLHNSLEYTATKLQSIQAQTLNERGLQGRFWEQYLRPSIDIFAQHLAALFLWNKPISMPCIIL